MFSGASMETGIFGRIGDQQGFHCCVAVCPPFENRKGWGSLNMEAQGMATPPPALVPKGHSRIARRFQRRD